MDKFTVDLDQLLNDFEFSELKQTNDDVMMMAAATATNRPHHIKSEHNIVACPPVITMPKPPTAMPPSQQPSPPTFRTTKSSISNVFHSLNEYLSSDVLVVEEATNECTDSVAGGGGGGGGGMISDNNRSSGPNQEEEKDTVQEKHVLEEQELSEKVKLRNEKKVQCTDGPESQFSVEQLKDSDEDIDFDHQQQADECRNIESATRPTEEVVSRLPPAAVVAEEQSVVSFNDDLDVPEEELEKYLNDLEQENVMDELEKELEPKEEIVTHDAVMEPSSDLSDLVDRHPSPASSVLTCSDISSPPCSATLDPELGTPLECETPISPSYAIGPDMLGKQAPVWLPDNQAQNCMHCTIRFTLMRRRHHCRACGLVFCAKCCHLRMKLQYMMDQGRDEEVRVCHTCYERLYVVTPPTNNAGADGSIVDVAFNLPTPSAPPLPDHGTDDRLSLTGSDVTAMMTPSSSNQNLQGVTPVVGVLKRKGSSKLRSNKSVIFCDGVRPGTDISGQNKATYSMCNGCDYGDSQQQQHPMSDGSSSPTTTSTYSFNKSSDTHKLDADRLPPVVHLARNEYVFTEYMETHGGRLFEHLQTNPAITFALHQNLFVTIKSVSLDCCVRKKVWLFVSRGLMNVGQDEVIVLLEQHPDDGMTGSLESIVRDTFEHLLHLYSRAERGLAVKELGVSLHPSGTALYNSKKHAGFLFVRPTLQCTQHLQPSGEPEIAPDPFLVAILIHRWETAWAKLFPLRLLLRLGAEYRCYPTPLLSVRYRDSVFVEVGHTIINLLADFRNFNYTLAQVHGLTVHIEDRQTTVNIPSNRYDDVMKCINNSSDHILAFAGCFSLAADSHLVCIQDTLGKENTYSTQLMNCSNKTRKVTGASFIVFNGSLKPSSGVLAKCSIIEDGIMVQVTAERMVEIRDRLRAMKNDVILCGGMARCAAAALHAGASLRRQGSSDSTRDGEVVEQNESSGTNDTKIAHSEPLSNEVISNNRKNGTVEDDDDQEESVKIEWGADDGQFNVGVQSPIDNFQLDGIPSIRVHNGKDYQAASATGAVPAIKDVLFIRWTEVFILQNKEETGGHNTRQEPVDISRVSEVLAKAVCTALVPYLGLLMKSNFAKLGVRVVLQTDNVSYVAGSHATKLPPIYMKHLDNELIPALHNITSGSNFAGNVTELELIFRILRR